MNTSDEQRAAPRTAEAGSAPGVPEAPAGPARSAKTWPADLGVLCVAVVWGSTYAAMQWTGQFVSVPVFLFLRFALGALAVTMLSLRMWRRVTSTELKLGLLFGVLLLAILFLETLGVRYTLASNAGFLIALSVMLVPLMERVFLKGRVARGIYPLALLSLAGCALLTFEQGLSVRSGDLIILAAALIRAAQIVLFGSRAKGQEVSILRVTAIELWVVAAGGLLLALATPARSWQQIAHLPGDAWLAIVYLGVLGTAFAFLVQLHAARVTSPTRVGLVLSTEPFFAAVFAVILVSERLEAAQLIGGGFILFAAITGRLLDARYRPPTPTPTAAPKQSPMSAPTPTPTPTPTSTPTSTPVAPPGDRS